MDTDAFWAVIATLDARDDTDAGLDSGTGELPTARRAHALAGWVVAAGDDDLRGFHTALVVQRNRAYRWNLWAAGHLALGGMSDDAFLDFRTWLLLHGRETFERVLADPDALADLSWDEDQEEFGHAERAGYLAVTEWEDRTESRLRGLEPEPAEPAGEPFLEDDDQWFRTRFPRLSKRADTA